MPVAQNTTSGTSIDFTAVPPWVKRITVALNAVSTSGTDALMLQIGSGSVTNSGYTGATSGGYSGNTVSGAAFTAGFGLNNSSIAANSNYAQAVLVRLTGNTWQYSSNMSCAVSQVGLFNGGGVVALGGALDRVRLTTLNGTDTFDAGSVNVIYE
jgi:hypothetical protein